MARKVVDNTTPPDPLTEDVNDKGRLGFGMSDPDDLPNDMGGEPVVHTVENMEDLIAQNQEAEKAKKQAQTENTQSEQGEDPQPKQGEGEEPPIGFIEDPNPEVMGRRVSEFVSELIVNQLPFFAHQFSKIDEKQLLKLLEEEKITAEQYELINRKNANDKTVFEIPDFISNELTESLAAVLQKRSLEKTVSPESRLGMSAFMLTSYVAYQTYTIKQENDILMAQIKASLNPKVPETDRSKRRRKK